jgi:superfamily I DNA and/or RNA helicase
VNNNSNNNNNNMTNLLDDKLAQQLLQSWNWLMPVEDRWHSISHFLLIMSAIIHKLKSQAEEYVDDARRRKNEAGAQAFRNAKIVGATVVGAARRLEAIRVAEPFAVIVEESCEVMEPTLIAVLAVKSLRKLELIGDHRQLVSDSE